MLDKLEQLIYDIEHETEAGKKIIADFQEMFSAIDKREADLIEESKSISPIKILEWLQLEFDKQTDMVTVYSGDNNLNFNEILMNRISTAVATYFNITDPNQIDYKLFLSGPLGNEGMFIDWFVPLEINNEHWTLESIYGQGEQYFIFAKQTSENKYTTVTKWYKYDEILNTQTLEYKDRCK